MSKMPAHLKTTVAAATNKENAPSVAASSKAIMRRRSKSFSSMREITSREETDRAIITPTIIITPTAPRVAAKRPAASTLKAPSEPKAAKQMKPAPYSLDAEANLLSEMYKEYKQQCSSASDEPKVAKVMTPAPYSLDAEANLLLEMYKEYKQQCSSASDALKEMPKPKECGSCATKLEELNVMSEEVERWKNKYAELKTNKAKTDRELADLQEKYESTMNERKLLKENVAKLEENLQLFKKMMS